MTIKVKGAALVLALIIACFTFSACSGAGSNAHEIKNSKGVVLITDDAINVNDSAAQSKIEEYLSDGNAEQMKSGLSNEQMSVDIYAKGNALVMEYYITVDLDDDQKSAVKGNLTPMMTNIKISDGRTDTGVENLVVVYALLDKQNNLIMSDIIK